MNNMGTELSEDKKTLYVTPPTEGLDKESVKRQIDVQHQQRAHYVRQIEAIDATLDELEANYLKMK